MINGEDNEADYKQLQEQDMRRTRTNYNNKKKDEHHIIVKRQ